MDIENVEFLMKIFDVLSNHYSDYNNFNLAMYIYMRYGIRTFNDYKETGKIEKINKELKKHHTLFDEELNYEIDTILNSKEL